MNPAIVNDTASMASIVQIALLVSFTFAAAVSDWRTLRIPNRLTFTGACIAVLSHAVAPLPGHDGALWALVGLATGLVMMLPLYALRIVGAGDAKVMAMVGAFVGMQGAVQVLLLSCIAAGVGALVYALRRGMLHRLVANTQALLHIGGGAHSHEPPEGIGRIPFAVSVFAGTTAYVAAKQLGQLA